MTAAAVAVLVILVVVLWWLAARARRRRRLSAEFAGEYDRTVSEQGSRGRAEDELLRRRERHDRLRLRPLSAQDKARFGSSWQDLQEQFVDRPYGTVMQAEELIRHLMAQRGYPVQSFEQEAADLSVEHPQAVQDLRAAHELISGATVRPSTEELRIALVQYRRLFAELLEPDEDADNGQAPFAMAAPRAGHRRAPEGQGLPVDTASPDEWPR
jgi:hypothetical protein